MPFSEEEWAQTPAAVQEFVLALVARVRALDSELSALHERVNRNSHNSSKPPSSEAISVPVDEMREYVKEQPVVHMDETGWREATRKLGSGWRLLPW